MIGIYVSLIVKGCDAHRISMEQGYYFEGSTGYLFVMCNVKVSVLDDDDGNNPVSYHAILASWAGTFISMVTDPNHSFYAHFGRFGHSMEPMVTRLTYVIQQPPHIKVVNKGTSEGSGGYCRK